MGLLRRREHRHRHEHREITAEDDAAQVDVDAASAIMNLATLTDADTIQWQPDGKKKYKAQHGAVWLHLQGDCSRLWATSIPPENRTQDSWNTVAKGRTAQPIVDAIERQHQRTEATLGNTRDALLQVLQGGLAE